MRRLAFTLIELLVVMAITAVLLTLIVLPIVQSFNVSRQAAAFADAQDSARKLGERIAREIAVSAGVRDNSGDKGSVLATFRSYGWTAAAPMYSSVNLPYGKLDIMKPAEGEPGAPGAGFINPGTGLIDPTLHAPKGQITLPVAPGSTIVRYHIGLHSPVLPDPANPGQFIADTYNNPYDDILMAAYDPGSPATRLVVPGTGRDNLYVLWRSEVQPYIYSNIQNKFVVNKALFYDVSRLPVAGDPLSVGETPASRQTSLMLRNLNTSTAAFDYPAFFDLSNPADAPVYKTADPDGTPDPSKGQMILNWVSKGQIVSALDHSDMVQPIYDKQTQLVVYEGLAPHAVTDAPKVEPLVQFRPTRISSEPAEGQMAVRPGEETDNANLEAPDVYRTKYPQWSNPVIRTYSGSWDQTKPALDLYLLARNGTDAVTGQIDQGIFAMSPSVDGTEGAILTELFDVTAYKSGGAFPFSTAISAANTTNGNNGKPDWTTIPNLVNNFIAYAPDPARGSILASFGVNEVGGLNTVPGYAAYDPNNLPQAGIALAETPLVDNGAGATYSPLDGAATYDVNRCFNKVWNDVFGKTLRPDIQRFIDLRVTPQGDGTPSPLPLNLASADPQAKYHYPRAHIVPGSEQVFGPDQNPGPNYGQQVLYTRTTRTPGPNQYRINYVDQPIAPGGYALLGFPGDPPAIYDPTDLESAVFEPRYKAGYIQLNSDPTVPLPQDTIVGAVTYPAFSVYYKFQMTQRDDVFAVDYDSRQIMSVLLTVKHFPQQGLSTAQNVTIPVTAKVRNFLR